MGWHKESDRVHGPGAIKPSKDSQMFLPLPNAKNPPFNAGNRTLRRRRHLKDRLLLSGIAESY